MNIAIVILKFIFNISILLLIIISLYPGSLVGFILYDDISRELDFINNPAGTAINHFIYFFYVSTLGLCLYLRNKNFKKFVYGLFFLSITLEILHLIVPNRAFELGDLIGNFLGVLVAYFLVRVYLHFSKP